jgi:hypothetical protein
MVVSWNRGGEWSAPEQAAEGAWYYSHLASDSHGRMYLFYGGLRPWYGVYRLSRPGVEETPSTKVRASNVLPAVVRGSLFLPGANGEGRKATGVLLDATGRKVVDLRAGANDVSGLAPGVYFLREYSVVSSQHSGAAGSERSAAGLQKVIVAK